MNRFSIFFITIIISYFNQVEANQFKTEKWLTKNGVQVVFYLAPEVPMLDISVAFAAGSAYDGSRYGLSNLTTHMINQGSDGKNATIIAQELADTGSQINSETNRDMVVFSLRTLTNTEALQQSTTVFSQIINHPDFPDESFIQEKKQLLMSIAHSEESADNVAITKLFENLYQQHPYAHPVNGTRATVSALTKKDISNFYKQYFIANNATLVMVGAVDSQRAHQIAELVTQDLSKGSPALVIPLAVQLLKPEKMNIDFPSSQTIIRIGQIGINHKNPNYFPLLVGNYILGGGTLVSRLGEEVREKRGLTYGISSQFTPMPGNGPFIISLSTKNNQAINALKITEDTLNNFVTNGPNQDELDAAKKYLTGSFPLSLASNSAIASLLLRMSFYHLPENYLDTYLSRINAVTVDEIKTAFKEQVHPTQLSVVTVGPS